MAYYCIALNSFLYKSKTASGDSDKGGILKGVMLDISNTTVFIVAGAVDDILVMERMWR